MHTFALFVAEKLTANQPVKSIAFLAVSQTEVSISYCTIMSVYVHKAFEHMQIMSGALLEGFAVELCVPYVALEASADAAGTSSPFPYADTVVTCNSLLAYLCLQILSAKVVVSLAMPSASY